MVVFKATWNAAGSDSKPVETVLFYTDCLGWAPHWRWHDFRLKTLATYRSRILPEHYRAKTQCRSRRTFQSSGRCDISTVNVESRNLPAFRLPSQRYPPHCMKPTRIRWAASVSLSMGAASHQRARAPTLRHPSSRATTTMRIISWQNPFGDEGRCLTGSGRLFASLQIC